MDGTQVRTGHLSAGSASNYEKQQTHIKNTDK
jgi:hypothetical protein